MAAYRIQSDLIVEILVCLPVKSLLRFKSVCKDWYTLINSSLFIHLHLNKSLNFRHNHTLFYSQVNSLCVVDDIYLPSKPITLYWPKDILSSSDCLYTVGSCNGLVCLRVTGGHALNWKVSCFLICNPSTQTFKFKPNFPFLELKHFKIWELSYGFGYDGKHDDYKIVATRKSWEKGVRVLYIYSFKADLWKCVTLTHTAVEGSSGSYYQKLDSSAVFTNNMLHYIIVYSPVVKDNKDLNYRIARFDLSLETWKDDLSFPVSLKLSTYVHLGVLDDCLYVCLVESYCCHNIWVMKGYRDEDYSWSIKYNIPANLHDYSLVAASKEGPLRLLFVDKYFDYSGIHHIMWYNPYDCTTESFRIQKSSSESSLHHCITSLATIPGSSFNYRASRKQLK